MFKDGLYTSNVPDEEEASDAALTAARRLKLLSALERELTSYLEKDGTACAQPNRNDASARLLGAILHCPTTVWD
jgi:hypothetical protein